MPLFDPVTGRLRNRSDLLSIQFSGQGMAVPRSRVDDEGNKVTPFLNENDGQLGGFTTEHPSGRVDVNVSARPVEASVRP